MELHCPQTARAVKSSLLLTYPVSLTAKTTRRKTELLESTPDPHLVHTEGSERPGAAFNGRNYTKRLSLDLRDVNTPNLHGGRSGQSSRKTPAKLRQEVGVLEDFGFKTAAAVPTEIDVFRDRRRSKLCFSTMDLWGPDHARVAVRAMGFYDAFRTIEDRDKRLGLALETASTARFNSRIADDLMFMKMLNRPMVRSVSNFEVRQGSKTDRAPAKRGTKRLNKIFLIMDSCDRLTQESHALRKTLTPLEEILLLRRQRLLRRARK